MRFLVFFTCLSALALVTLFEAEARGGAKQLKFTAEWKGSVDDETLQKSAPNVITTAKGLEKVWKAWKIESKLPEIDFKKEIVVVATTSGSLLKLNAPRLDDDGNLQLLAIATRDLRPGFRFVLASVSRDGVKTVNKKELPKE